MIKITDYKLGWRVYADGRKTPCSNTAVADEVLLSQHYRSIARRRCELEQDNSPVQLSLYDQPEPIKPQNKSVSLSSVFRARRRLYQIACCNDWQYFATFTYRGDNENAAKSILGFFNDFQRNHHCKISYLGVFERGEQTNRLHFHCLLRCPSSFIRCFLSSEYARLPFSLKKYYSSDVDKNRLFTCQAWFDRPFGGYNSIIKIDGSPKVYRYITKYLDVSTKICRYFIYRSRNLSLPDEYYVDFIDWSLLESIAKFKSIYGNGDYCYSIYSGDGPFSLYCQISILSSKPFIDVENLFSRYKIIDLPLPNDV